MVWRKLEEGWREKQGRIDSLLRMGAVGWTEVILFVLFVINFCSVPRCHSAALQATSASPPLLRKCWGRF